MNKLIQNIKNEEGYSIFEICSELMNNHRNLSGGYDQLTKEEEETLFLELKKRIENWKQDDRFSKRYEVSYDLAVLELCSATLCCVLNPT